MNKRIDSTLLIAFFSAALYWAYSRYFIGFCNEIGINPDVIDKNIHQVLFYGIHIFLFPMIKIFSLGIICFSSLYMFLKLLKSRSAKDYIKNNKFLNIIATWLHAANDYTNDFIDLKKIIFYFSTLFIASILFIEGSGYFQNLGSKSAIDFMENIKKSKFNKNKISISINGNKKDLILIDCGSSKCVGYDFVDKKMLYFQITNDFYSDVKASKFFE